VVFGTEQRRIAVEVANQSTSVDPVQALQEGIPRYLTLIANDPGAARITLLDAPGVLGWQKWRSCDDGPFRIMLVAAFGSIQAVGRLRSGLVPDVLAELILGAMTEAALIIATSKRQSRRSPRPRLVWSAASQRPEPAERSDLR
jgi:hypothetical protein